MTSARPEVDETPGPEDLPGDRPADRERLPTRTRGYWTAQALLVGVPVTGLFVLWAVASGWFTPGVRWTVAALVAVLLIGVRAGIAPRVRHRLFWYAISETEIDVQHGFLVTSRTVVPMSRVQYLRSEHGVLADRFALANLHVHTAAGSVPLPGLDRAVADEVRARISRWAHLDDDV
ncbi:PH domain-containing protein [Nakamurella flavida]|uniref:PH domain-containing protein n=1 Tax=Nakamurella flavida TaxID=363630 RepID=A0A938YLT8_9ACTN|nr:PH domain-containing protein [Nakamurella flavida]MBM9477063.1 PH domain-containing protein [Nakamurella flavida]MDP9780009.1 membrane protein YdbS with pleckstrin-like domain [Nakamurella flavida]